MRRTEQLLPMPILPVYWVSTWSDEVRWVDIDGRLWSWKVAAVKGAKDG